VRATGAPGTECVEYAATVEDAETVEHEIHRELSHCRHRGDGSNAKFQRR
jgi:hypothetical protein